jgi:Uma2 family endonuclease
VKEAQPDSSYYVGKQAAFVPQGRSIVNLDESPAPDLAVEIADSSLSDDLGKKRLLYEELGIREYWVVDVEKAQIIAFAIVENGSRRISTSSVIAGLDISLIETALQQCRTLDDAQVVQWAMQHFS